jgi:2-dehydropantoate 2-reductase
MRYLIFGAGGVGGVIGGRLAQHGSSVVLIARGSHLDALRKEGLRLRDPLGEVRLALPAVGSIAEAAPVVGDVVLLTMKTQDTEVALGDLAEVAPPEIAIVCAQNGIENERLALRRFANVHGMSVVLPASFLEPGVVHAESAPVSGVLDVGRYPIGLDAVDAQLVTDLRDAQFDAYADPDVMRWKHTKLLSNLGNALEAAVGSGARGSGMYKRARDEGIACLQAAGMAWAGSDEEAAHRANLSPLGDIDGQPRQGGSSWQSLARGSSRVETDWLNGEIVLLGALHGIPTPVNAALQRVANHMARTGAPPGSMAIGDLEAAVDSP